MCRYIQILVCFLVVAVVVVRLQHQGSNFHLFEAATARGFRFG